MKRTTQDINDLVSEWEDSLGKAPINPLKRVRQANDLTLDALSNTLGITKQALIRNEQGTYTNPSETLLAFYEVNFGVTAFSLRNQYEEYQHIMRSRCGLLFGPTLESVLENRYSEDHPLRTLRQAVIPRVPGGISVTALSKNLCMPQATLEYWERKPRRQQTVPSLFIEVLHQLGYSYNDIDYLVRSYKTFRNSL